MIQRIQTLYLLIATVLSSGLIFVFDLWKDADGNSFFAIDGFNTGIILVQAIPTLFFVSAVITFLAIFQFKKRNRQILMNRIAILINFILVGVLVYFTQNLSGEISVSEKGIGLLIPILTIVIIALANKAIKKDEELVKSVDRLR